MKTAEQLVQLAAARSKAYEIRKLNGNMKTQEKELKKLEREDKQKSLDARMAKFKKPQEDAPVVAPQEEQPEEEPEDEPEELPPPKMSVIKRKPTEKKKKIVYVEPDQDSSSDEEIVYVSRPKKEKKSSKKVYAYRDESPEPAPKSNGPIRFNAMEGNRAELFHRMFNM